VPLTARVKVRAGCKEDCLPALFPRRGEFHVTDFGGLVYQGGLVERRLFRGQARRALL